jgi:plastocyanin
MKRSPSFVLAAVLAASAVLAACGPKDASPPPAAPAAPAAGAPAPAPAAGGGAAYDPAKADATIVVKATLKGAAPKMRPIKMDDKCAAMHGDGLSSEEIVASADGKLANVIGYVAKGHEAWSYKAPAEAVVIDQKGCQYHPHVFTAMVGQSLTIKNSDPVMHNVKCEPKANDPFNRSQLEGAKDLNEKFTKPEIGINLVCNVHGWMSTWSGIFAHPFHGVTGDDGTVKIKVPAGEYEIGAWHESSFVSKTIPTPKLTAPAAQKVKVGAGETKEVEFVYEVK